MLVGDVMTWPVVTVERDTAVKAAATILTVRGFTALPVVDHGRLVGVVTEADLVRGRVRHDPRSTMLRRELGSNPPPATVGAVMTRDMVTARSGTDVADLVAIMLGHQIRSIPVLEGGKLVGIVSRRDVLATFTRADLAVANAVRCRLRSYNCRGWWDVSVHEGVVQIIDIFDDDAELHTVRVLVSAVPGVLDVEVVPAPG